MTTDAPETVDTRTRGEKARDTRIANENAARALRADPTTVIVDDEHEMPVAAVAPVEREPLNTFAPALADMGALEQAARQTWRIVARNPVFNGTTEDFGFTNGEAVVTALPRGATCDLDIERCEAGGLIDGCRLHRRMRHLAALANYAAYETVVNPRTGRSFLRQTPGYRVLTEDEYDLEFGERSTHDGTMEIPDI